MASVLGVTALLGAMRCGAGDPPPQGDDGGSGGGMNGITSPVKHRTSGVGGFSRFSVLLTMLLLVLGLAGTASAQSNASELEDGGLPYLMTSVSNVITYSVRITDTGGGNVSVEVTNISAFPNISLGSQQADDTNGYGVGGPDQELVFTDSSGDTIAVYIGTPGDDLIVSVAGYDCELIFGMDGSDDITGGSLGLTSTVMVFGGDGGDVILTDDGPDDIFGGFRSISYTSSGTDYVDAQGGADTVFGDDLSGGIVAYCGSGNDFALGGANDDFIYGETGCDDLLGGAGDDHLYGDGDDDLRLGMDGSDHLEGGSGKDALDGGDDADDLYGGSEGDWLHDSDGTDDDYLYGEDGNDDIFSVDGGNDFLYGGADNDDIWWNTGDYVDHGTGTPSTFTAGTGPAMGYTGATAEIRFLNYAAAILWGGNTRCP